MDGGIPNLIAARPIAELEAEITELAGHLNAANHRWLMLIAEFDNRNGWSDWATQSCAHWLNWKIGITLGAAREKVRVAHALQKLPKIAASMEKGELSYYKVRELTRVASPETEDTLLMIAQHGSAHHVETVVRHFRRAKEAQELTREQEQQTNRALSYHFDDDGSLILKGRLPAEAGAVFLKALELSVDEVRSNEPTDGEDVPAGTSTVKSTLRMKRVDALTLMAESFLQHSAEAMNGGDKFQVVIHVSEEAASHLCGEPAPALWSDCRFEEGVAIASETAHRLACDCSVVRITEDEQANPLDIGRKTRSIPPSLKRALNSRDQGCRFPGCCNKKYVDGHHIEHWANGGETKLGNLITLCYFHHRLVHEGGWNVQVLDDGAFRFLKPNGETLISSCTQHGSLSCPSLISRSPSRPAQWSGDKMDYGLAVEVLCQREARAKNIPAGTRA